MFYQEKVINGIICFRTTPKGEWVEMSKEQLTKRIQELSLKNIELRAVIEIMGEELEYYRAKDTNPYEDA